MLWILIRKEFLDMVRDRRALVTSFVVPLLLYAFFAHVAGVAIPQGNFVRLP